MPRSKGLRERRLANECLASQHLKLFDGLLPFLVRIDPHPDTFLPRTDLLLVV